MKRNSAIAARVVAALLIGVPLLIFFSSRHPDPASGTSQCPPVSATSPGRPLSWIVGAHPVQQLEQAGASPQLINAAFSNNQSYVYGSNPSRVGVPTADYTSYASIKAAFRDGTLPGQYKAVIYDNERWQLTPHAEQVNPQLYERLTALLLHQHGLIYIATPAPDLTWSAGNPGVDSYLAYLQRGIAGTAARYADVVDIQAQVRETNLPAFTSFVRAAVLQARQSNPQARVLVGLRTNPDPYTGTAATRELIAAYNSVATLADGYWLNVNGHPQPAVCLLRQIYGSG